MSSGRDLGMPGDAGEQPGQEADDQPAAVAAAGQPVTAAFTDADFVGPLRPADQAWAEHTLRADTSAALFEPADNVIRRREAHIAGLYRMATLLTLTGDLGGGGAAGFRAIAESRALAEFMAASPAYCLDCFLLGDRCRRHQPGEGSPDGPGSGAGGSSSSGSGSGGSRSGGSRSGGSGSGGSGASSGSVSGPGAASDGPGSGSGSGGSDPGATGPAGPTPGTGRKAPRRQPGHQPEWRRFGADEFPSASG